MGVVDRHARRGAGRSPAVDLVVIGDVNPDILVAGADPRFGQHEQLVDAIEITIGGSAAIVATAAARLGVRTAVVGVIGDDPLGRFMLGELGRCGVDVSGCRVDATRPTGASVILARGADRAILTASGAIAALRAGDVPAERLAARHVHIASYFLLAGLWPGLPSIIREAHLAGASVSIDPNWDPAGSWDAGLPALMPELDLFLPNEAEARRIAGAIGDGPRPGFADEPADEPVVEVARRLAARGGRRTLVAVKRGAAGALAVAGDGTLIEVPPLKVAVTDATGAGDAFDAGLIAARLEGRSVGDSLVFAAACGALSTRALGGTAGQPTREEVDAALAGW
jgi:sugar/nucleoside kinase (ribokinase family)